MAKPARARASAKEQKIVKAPTTRKKTVTPVEKPVRTAPKRQATPKPPPAVKKPVTKKAVTKKVVAKKAVPTKQRVQKKPSTAKAARPRALAKKRVVAPATAEVKRQLVAVRESLEDDKAENIIVIDVMGRTSIADYLVIASGRSNRQVGAIAQHLVARLEKTAIPLRIRTEGMPQNDWVLIDTGDIIIHIFRPEVREFYRLEKIWEPGLDEDDALTATGK